MRSTIESLTPNRRFESVAFHPALRARAQPVAYLKFWQGMMAVTEVSLVGWLVSAPDTPHPALWSFAAAGVITPAVVILFVSVALDAARRAK